jgi:hypothetical protein
MLPRERIPRSTPRAFASTERCVILPRIAICPSARRVRSRRAIAGCALGVCLAWPGCAPGQLPSASLVYRHERDSQQRDHRVELWLTHAPQSRDAILSLDLEPILDAYDPCPGVPFCDARDRLIEKAERSAWFDPSLEDDATERRLDDLILAPEEAR